MNFKSFFFALLLAASFTFAGTSTEARTLSSVSFAGQSLSGQDQYTYVHVEIDGQKWVLVYDEDGNLVIAYPEG